MLLIYNNVRCGGGGGVTYNTGFRLDLLTPYTQYSGLQAITVISLIYTLYSSSLHTHWGSQSSLVVSWQRIYNRLSLQITHEPFFAQHNSFLAIILQLPTQFSSSALKPISWEAGVSKLDCLFSTELLFITTLHGPRRKHSPSVVESSCLQRRCIATEVTRLLQRDCVYRVVA
jgi:hypothetical protein